MITSVRYEHSRDVRYLRVLNHYQKAAKSKKLLKKEAGNESYLYLSIFRLKSHKNEMADWSSYQKIVALKLSPNIQSIKVIILMFLG